MTVSEVRTAATSPLRQVMRIDGWWRATLRTMAPNAADRATLPGHYARRWTGDSLAEDEAQAMAEQRLVVFYAAGPPSAVISNYGRWRAGLLLAVLPKTLLVAPLIPHPTNRTLGAGKLHRFVNLNGVETPRCCLLMVLPEGTVAAGAWMTNEATLCCRINPQSLTLFSGEVNEDNYTVRDHNSTWNGGLVMQLTPFGDYWLTPAWRRLVQQQLLRRCQEQLINPGSILRHLLAR